MPIVTGKTPEGLIKHAQKAFNENGGMSGEPLATN